MGSILYDFLQESFLFDEAGIRDGFTNVTDAALRIELARYRALCLDRLDQLSREIPRSRPNSVLFSGRRLSVEELKCTALYVEAHIIDDPLFRHTRERSAATAFASKHLGYSEHPLDRREICSALRFLREITPMVAENYVKLLPISRIYEPPSQVPFTYSQNYFSDVLPAHVLRFFHERADVCSMVRSEEGWQAVDGVRPSRGIYIDFKGDTSEHGHVYHLHDGKPHIVDEATRLVRFEMTMPDEPPDQERFKAWLFQSVNQAARNVHNAVLAEFATSEQCGAMYLARSQFAFDLLALLGKEPSRIPAFAVTSLLDIDIPVLEGVSCADLMRVRRDEEAFVSLRDALEQGFSELRLERDPDALKVKTENFVNKLTNLDVREADRQINRLQRSAFAEAGLATAGLLASFSSNGASLLAVAAALFQGFKTYQEYRRNVAGNPAFLLWKMKRSSGRGT